MSHFRRSSDDEMSQTDRIFVRFFITRRLAIYVLACVCVSVSCIYVSYGRMCDCLDGNMSVCVCLTVTDCVLVWVWVFGFYSVFRLVLESKISPSRYDLCLSRISLNLKSRNIGQIRNFCIFSL